MLTTLRAALSVALLLGFYLYALGVAAVFGVLAAWVIAQGRVNSLVVSLVAVTVAVAGSVLYATWKVMRTRNRVAEGLVLSEQRAPGLWALTRELASAVGTRPPDEIRLVAEVNAAVSENTRMLGLVGGRRYMYVGLPLLQSFTVAQLRSVLAHELGHYSHQHVRLGAPVHRGRAVILETIRKLPERTLARWLLVPYARLYFLVSAAVSRVQEIEADRASVRLAGRRAAISAMRELGPLAAAWQFYLQNYVVSGLDSGYAPAGVLAHFPTLLEARAGEMTELRAQAPDAERSRWDSHPPAAERIALMQREPDPPLSVDDRPAGGLVRHLDSAQWELEDVTFDFGDRPRVPFEQYTAAAVHAGQQLQANELYRAAGRMMGGQGSLAVVLELLAAGHFQPLAASLLPDSILADPRAAAQGVTDALASAIAAAVVRFRAGYWQHSWSRAATLVAATGEPIDQWQLAARAVYGEAAKVHQELASRGVDLAAVTVEQGANLATEAEPVAGITNAVVDGKRRDLIITNLGFLIFPTLPFMQQGKVQQRMRMLVNEGRPGQLATIPEHRFVPYEEIASGAMTRRFPATFLFHLRSDRRLTIRWSRRSEEVGKGWETVGRVVGTLSRTN
jgi:Zn-dependent protease with chaperone function